MDYGNVTSSGEYLRADILNTIVIVSEFVRRFNGPFNIDLSKSEAVTDHVTLYINEKIHDIGGCDYTSTSYRVFNILYKTLFLDGCYYWNDVRLTYVNDTDITVTISGANALPEAISDMSNFNMQNFECIRGYDHNA